MNATELISRYFPDAKKTGDGYSAKCPGHPDSTASLSIGDGDDGRALLHCHAGCSIDAICRGGGFEKRDLFATNGNGHANNGHHSNGHATRNGAKKAKKTYADADAAIEGMKRWKRDARLMRIYEYGTDYKMLRFENDTGKEFVPIHRNGGGWVSGSPKVRPLYRLAEISESRDAIIVEGEKAADAGHAIGLPCTTSPHGAKSPEKTDWTPLTGKDVVILPDNDDAGRNYAKTVAKLLRGIAKSVRIVTLPNLPDKGDLFDYLEARDGADVETLQAEIEALVDSTEPLDVAELADESQADAGDRFTIYPLTEFGNASRLAAQSKGKLHYSRAFGWIEHDGKRHRINQDARAQEYAKQSHRSIHAEAADCPDDGLSLKIAEWARKCQTAAKVAATLKLAQSEPTILIADDAFDADPFAFNTEDGLLDLLTGKLHPHSPDQLVTKLATVKYDPAATAPIFEKFVREIFPDEEIRDYMQRFAGYTLSADTSERQFIIGYGHGDNGKSTYLSALGATWGDYAITTTSQTFMTGKRGSIENDIARLAGARMVIVSEVDDGARFDVPLLKRYVGGSDKITARYLYREFFDHQPTGKLWLACNHKPSVNDTTNSIWNRLRLVPYTTTIPRDRIDPTLPEKLATETSGILNWALEGFRRWRRDGLHAPESVMAATREYREANDILGLWIEDCCDLSDAYTEQAAKLYESYREWAKANGHAAMSNRTFGERMKDKFESKKTNAGRIYNGIQVITSAFGYAETRQE